MLHCYAVSRVDNAIPCHRTGYDRHDIHVIACIKREKKSRGTKIANRNKTKSCRAPPAGDVADNT